MLQVQFWIAISFRNIHFIDYVTEKMMNVLQAGSVPGTLILHHIN
jgi:hypothetical protein